MGFKLIPEDEVPPHRRSRKKWRAIYDEIPPGMAVVFKDSKGTARNIFKSLRFLKKRGGYQNFYVTIRQGNIYIVNREV